jgi:hypothetical protein|tara:strand:+ start:1412 stop:1720 length:309 start_codon:yes stop_codon:yes gene_type:complete
MNKKVTIETLLNKMAERLINIELVLLEHRKVIDHFASRMDHVYKILSEVDVDITEDEKDRLSTYLNEYADAAELTGSDATALREFKKELEKYRLQITTYGES